MRAADGGSTRLSMPCRNGTPRRAATLSRRLPQGRAPTRPREQSTGQRAVVKPGSSRQNRQPSARMDVANDRSRLARIPRGRVFLRRIGHIDQMVRYSTSIRDTHLSVPMSKPRYTAVESQLMISPPNRSASARASALLPVAVDPSTASTRGLDIRSANTEEHVEDEHEQDDEKTELLRSRDHRRRQFERHVGGSDRTHATAATRCRKM